jgi:hypothetical protein
VLAEQKERDNLLTTESTEYTTSPGSEVKIQLLLHVTSARIGIPGITVRSSGGLGLSALSVVILYAEKRKDRVDAQVPSAADIRAGYYPIISVLSQKTGW